MSPTSGPARGEQAAGRIIVCADDFGMNPAIDQGVLELARLGRLNAASCLVDGPCFAADAQALRASGLQAGLHLNFTEPYPGMALAQPLAALIRQAYLRRLDMACVRGQIARQFDRFEDVMQRAPDFVDGHQHVHQLPWIRDALLAEMARRYGAGGQASPGLADDPAGTAPAFPRPWLRGTRAPAQPGIPWRHRAKAGVIQALGARALARRAAGRFGMNRRFVGVYDFQGGGDVYAALLARWLEQMRAGDLLMCHPASHIMREDTLGEQRVAEFRVLAAPETGRHLARLGLVL